MRAPITSEPAMNPIVTDSAPAELDKASPIDMASPPGGGVYRFKQGWGSRDVDYAYVTRITGDAEPFLNSEVEKIQAGYPWHYVLPFDRVGQSGARGSAPSSRATAWRAQEESRR